MRPEHFRDKYGYNMAGYNSDGKFDRELIEILVSDRQYYLNKANDIERVLQSVGVELDSSDKGTTWTYMK